MDAFAREVLTFDAAWLLDVCCGDARFSLDLLNEARAVGRRLQIVALDASDEALFDAYTRAGDDRLLRFVRADARDLPYPDASFDIATCRFALDLFDLEDAVLVLRELRRVARFTPLVWEVERVESRGFAADAIARLRTLGRPTFPDASVTRKGTYTMSELEDVARRAGWTAPTVLRSSRFIMLRDGE